MPMTREELRLKCLEIFVVPASKNSLQKGEVFELGEKAYKFIMRKPGEESKGEPEFGPTER